MNRRTFLTMAGSAIAATSLPIHIPQSAVPDSLQFLDPYGKPVGSVFEIPADWWADELPGMTFKAPLYLGNWDDTPAWIKSVAVQRGGLVRTHDFDQFRADQNISIQLNVRTTVTYESA